MLKGYWHNHADIQNFHWQCFIILFYPQIHWTLSTKSQHKGKDECIPFFQENIEWMLKSFEGLSHNIFFTFNIINAHYIHWTFSEQITNVICWKLKRLKNVEVQRFELLKICLPTKHQWAQENSFKHVCIPDQIRIWKCWLTMEPVVTFGSSLISSKSAEYLHVVFVLVE